MSVYIQTNEYATWGLTSGSTTDLLVMKASNLIDGHCHRQIGVTAYNERLYLPEDRNLARLSYGPFVAWNTSADPNNPTGLRGRYGYGRRGSAEMNLWEETTLLQISSMFGGPPSWTNIDTTRVDIDVTTGALWVPAGIYLAHYTEVDAQYTAGYATIPDAVKEAVVQLIGAFQNRIVPGLKQLKAGDRSMEFFTEDLLDESIRQLLAPYVVWALK